MKLLIQPLSKESFDQYLPTCRNCVYSMLFISVRCAIISFPNLGRQQSKYSTWGKSLSKRKEFLTKLIKIKMRKYQHLQIIIFLNNNKGQLFNKTLIVNTAIVGLKKCWIMYIKIQITVHKNSKENLCLKIKLCNFSDFMELFVPFQFLKHSCLYEKLLIIQMYLRHWRY